MPILPPMFCLSSQNIVIPHYSYHSVEAFALDFVRKCGCKKNKAFAYKIYSHFTQQWISCSNSALDTKPLLKSLAPLCPHLVTSKPQLYILYSTYRVVLNSNFLSRFFAQCLDESESMGFSRVRSSK